MDTTKKPSRPRAKPAVQKAKPGTEPATQPATQPTTQLTTEPETDKISPNVNWDNNDNQVMIDFLTAERQPADGKPIGPDNATTAHGFKTPTWVAAVKALAGSERKLIDVIVHLSQKKEVGNCKSRWLSGAGWEDGCITLPDEVWAPILDDIKKGSKKAKDYVQCKNQPFPLFNKLAPLLEGHKATAKYIKTSIKKPDNPPLEASTLTGTRLPATTHTLSPTSSTSELPHTDNPAHPKSDKDPSSDDAPARNRHGKSAVALKERNPVRKKKRSGVEIVDGLSTELHDIGSLFKSSPSSSSTELHDMSSLLKSSIPSTLTPVRSTTEAPPQSIHSQAVQMVYDSSLTCEQGWKAIELFLVQHLLAEPYISTPAQECDKWLKFKL